MAREHTVNNTPAAQSLRRASIALFREIPDGEVK